MGRLVSLGGLELENLGVCNRALLEKWLWWFLLESNALWPLVWDYCE